MTNGNCPCVSRKEKKLGDATLLQLRSDLKDKTDSLDHYLCSEMCADLFIFSLHEPQ